MYQYFIIISVS